MSWLESEADILRDFIDEKRRNLGPDCPIPILQDFIDELKREFEMDKGGNS